MSKKMKYTTSFFLCTFFVFTALFGNLNSVHVSASVNKVNNNIDTNNDNNIVDIQVQEVWKASQGDVSLKLVLSKKEDISKLELYINDAKKPFKVISDINNMGKEVSIPVKLLRGGKNKITVEAYGKASPDKKYTKIKYIDLMNDLNVKNINKNTTKSKSGLNVLEKATKVVKAQADYYTLKVYSPSNGNIDSANLELTSDDGTTSSYSLSDNATFNIPKEDVSGKTNIKVSIAGSDQYGMFAYISRDWNTSITEIKALSTTKKRAIKVSNPVKTDDSISGDLIVAADLKDNSYGVSASFSIDNTVRSKILNGGLYIWTDDTMVEGRMSFYAGDKNYGFFTDKINTASSNTIDFDEGNISKVLLTPQITSKYNEASIDFNRYTYISFNIEANKEYYMSKGSYRDVDIHLGIEHDSNIYYTMFSKKSLQIVDSSTYLATGGDFSGKLDYSYNSDNKVLNVYNVGVSDEYGANVSDLYGDSYKRTNYSIYNMSGKAVLQGTLNEDGSIDLSSLSNGAYDIVAQYSNELIGTVKAEKVRVVVGDCYTINISDASGVESDTSTDVLNYTLLDDTGKEVLSGINDYSINIPKTIVTPGKKYKLYTISKSHSYDGVVKEYIDALASDVVFDSNNDVFVQVDYSNETKELSVNQNDILGSVITIAGKDTTKISDLVGKDQTHNIVSLRLQKGLEYSFYNNILDSGNQYLLFKKYTPNDSDKSFTFERTNLSKLNITNNLNSSANNLVLNFKGSYGSNFNCEVKGANIYLAKDNYSVDAAFNYGQSPYRVRGTYNISSSNDTTDFKLGSAIKASSAKITDTNSSVGNTLNTTISDIYDGTVLLKDLNKAISSSSVMPVLELMHGNKVIKSYQDNKVPSTVGGEVNFRVNYSNSILGLVTDTATVNVNNPSLTSKNKSDINLDGIVDIFDIVYVSKEIGKTKAGSSDWDPRCNLNNADGKNQIDMIDLAEVAKNYN